MAKLLSLPLSYSISLWGGGGSHPKKNPKTTANLKFGTGFLFVFSDFFGFFFGFSVFADFDWFYGFWLSGFCWI